MKITPEIAALIAHLNMKSVVNVITKIHTMVIPALKVPHLDNHTVNYTLAAVLPPALA